MIPFMGFLSCPICDYRFVTLNDRMNSLPVWNLPGRCPRCGTSVIYPKWARSIVLVWAIYAALLLASFFASGLIFSIMIYGFIPMAVLTLVAGAWGMKLRECKDTKHDIDDNRRGRS